MFNLKNLNLMQNPFKKGLNKGRFRGSMECPFCSKKVDPDTTDPIGWKFQEKSKVRLKESLGPFIRVYKCYLCGGEWRYDILQEQRSPYESFKRGLNQLPGIQYSGRVPLIGKGKD